MKVYTYYKEVRHEEGDDFDIKVFKSLKKAQDYLGIAVTQFRIDAIEDGWNIVEDIEGDFLALAPYPNEHESYYMFTIFETNII